MIYNLDKKLICLLLCWLVCLCVLAGCKSPEEYKVEADEQVYNIIDKKWDKGFGSKVNYKISDTEPAPNALKVEKAVPASGVLGLPQAVALATAHNRQYQFEKEALYVKALDLRLSRYDFERQFFGNWFGGYTKEGLDEEAGHGIDSAAGVQGSAGFTQLLADGMFISTNITAAWVEILTGNLRGGIVSLLSATVAQPLLRGSGREIVQENLTQAERDALYQIRLFNRFRKTFVVSVISQYYRVLQQLDAVNNAKGNYDTLVGVYEKAKKLADGGRLPRFELNQAHQDKLQGWDIYIQEQRLYKQMLDEFKITLSLPTNIEVTLDQSELAALSAVGEIWPDFSEAEVLETALARRLDLANSRDAVADADRKVVVAADGLGADLNLVGGISDPSKRRANLITLEEFEREVFVGLEGGLPLDRVVEQNLYRKALILRSQQQRVYEEAVDLVKLEVRGAWRDLNEAAERHLVQLDNLELAKKRFENTMLLLQYGRANTRDVLDAQEDLFDAQNAATVAVVDYTIATLNFYRDTGVLAVRPDGMWQQFSAGR